jgi:large subunit ribosomal protein L25
MVEVEVVCLPGQVPEFIEVDLANVDLGQAVHLSDLAVPAGVQLHALMQGVEHDLSVAMVQKIGAGAEGAE